VNKDLKELRQSIDGDESFMSGGHQIKKIRKRARKIPEWSVNDHETRKVLERAFPKWKTVVSQRASAARWARAIHLYYRLRMPHNHVCLEMGIGYNTLRMMLRNIRRSAKGTRGRGRPRKK
jgi:hypothetical protein